MSCTKDRFLNKGIDVRVSNKIGFLKGGKCRLGVVSIVRIIVRIASSIKHQVFIKVKALLISGTLISASYSKVVVIESVIRSVL